MLLLMDGTSQSERLLDRSLLLFNHKTDRYQGAFVEGISAQNLEKMFDHPDHISNQYTRTEILERILHSNLENNSEFITRFVQKCEDLNLKTKVYLSNTDIDGSISSQSLFSDLFLISKSVFTHQNVNHQSFEAIKTLIKGTRCPILLLSPEQTDFETIVLVYDGTEASFETIKIFMYLMDDQVTNCKLMLYIIANDQSAEAEKSIIDYLKGYKLHFSLNRVFPEDGFRYLWSLTSNFGTSLVVTGVNREEIIEDLVLNKEHSFFMDSNRSIFLS